VVEVGSAFGPCSAPSMIDMKMTAPTTISAIAESFRTA
jgi:hypothetical protein